MSTVGKKIVLIGGAGFIGHNLALSLKNQGHEVSVIDSLYVNNILSFYNVHNTMPEKQLYVSLIMQRIEMLNRHGIPVFIQDARDYHALCKILSQEIKPQAVILLAAVAHADRSNKDPYSTFDHSLRTLENALDGTKSSIEHFIYFSSSMVYGNFVNGTVDEETICNPLGIYGALKYAGEKIVIAYNQVFDLPYTIVRPSALYGERCVSRRVLQIFIENALLNKPVILNGDGQDHLDFTYIDDLVQGISKIIGNPNAINQTLNLTYGQSRSLSDVVKILKTYIPEINVIHQPNDKLTPKRGTLSVEKAKTLVGYDPQFPIEKGIEKYLNWYKELGISL